MSLRTAMTTTTIATTIAAGAAFATDTPCEERVASDCSWVTIYPFNTISKLFFENPVSGSLTGYGTGFIVSPHCALTNGHCVYDRDGQRFLADDIHLMPGACRGESGWYENMFGTREAIHKHTNNKYADLDYSPRRAVDYGSLHYVCPFEELTTFMPLCFGYASDWAQMSGYPTDETPDDSLDRNQWLAYGDVTETADRWVRYGAHSTGGASGSPVWNWSTSETLVEVFAINSTHWTSCDGGGPRLVWQNETLIRDWMRWEPTLAQKFEAGCVEWTILPFFGLIEFFGAHPARLLEPDVLRLANPVGPPPTGPTRRMMQVIERGYYEWVEYDLQPGKPQSRRMIQLLTAPGMDLEGEEGAWFPGMPFDPQSQGWLSIDKATVLLSGSAGRAISDQVIGVERALVEADEIDFFQPQPDGGAETQDIREDDPVTEAEEICIGDLNGDGEVNGADLGLILGAWGPCTATPCTGDLNGDGNVNGADLGLILGAWGTCQGG